MFTAATAFDAFLGSWDVSNVTYMGFMFYGATAFDSFLGSWDVSNVTSCEFFSDGAPLDRSKHTQLH